MLEKIRAAVGSWIVRFFLVLSLIGFTFWEIPSILHYNNDTLFSSGNSIIKSQTYQTNLNDRIMRVSYQAGHYLTPEEIAQLQIPHMVMHQMQMNILLDEAARRLKLESSEKSSAFLLNEDPFFKGKDSQFDKSRFISYTQQANLTYNEIFDSLAKQTLRNQLILSITDGITIPEILSRAFSRYLRERRSITYLEFSKNLVPSPEDPDEESFSQWFAEKNALFLAPEYRQVSFIQLSATDIARPQDITPEEIKNVYENNIDQYVMQERRLFEKLQFEKQEQAEAAVEQLKKGVPFSSLVAKMGQTLKGIRSSLVKKADLPAPFGENVFSLKKGTISSIINTLQGPALVRVVEVKPAQTQLLESVEEEIRKDLAIHKALPLLTEKRKEIEEARFEGATLREIANEYKLPFRKIIFDNLGRNPEGSLIENFPDSSLFIPHVFQGSEGIDTDSLTVKNGYLWYHVERITPSRSYSLAEVRQDALALWKKEKINYLLDEKAALLKQALQDGKSFEKVASENALCVKSENDLQRIRISKIIGEEATLAAFSGGSGFITVARGKDKTSRIILQVTDVLDPESAESLLTTHENNKLAIGIKNDLLRQFLFLANKEHPIEINSELYNTLLSF